MGLRKTPRLLALTLGYAVLLQASYLAALLLRFEGDVPLRFWRGYLQIAPYFTVLSLAGFYLAGLYHGLWRYASTVTLFQIFKGVTLSALSLVVITVFATEAMFPRSLIVMTWLWELVLLGGVRFAWRLSRERILGPMPLRAGRALVVGADHTGVHLIQEMRRGPAGHEMLHPIGFIDDDARLTGHLVEGVKVFGTIADLPRVLNEERVEILIISDPDVPAKVVREIARFCDEANVRVMTLPGLSNLQQGRTALSQMRDMRIEDLLGRQPVQLNLGEVAEFLRHQRVLVTGGGGSIGSELARQVAGFDPASLVLLDHSENGLYYIHNELCSQHPTIPIHAIVADVKDAAGIEAVFERFRPTVVFHAAAHKHVPLLEANPREAVLNNISGTHILVQASDRHGVGKFVLISTDKAVNPTSVMGASKRVCEMLLQSRSQHSHTRFAAVRFGNVLGSDGSVIPLFQRQLARGGPVTVTHPEARRYFMTIPEAVRLVLQSGAMGRGGEVFLLDMGEQVRIVDLARQLIRMSGMREGEDVEIVFTGLRPGEKLYEELHSDAERTRITRHERILAWDLDARDEDELLAEVRELEAVARSGDAAAIKRQLHRLVPEYIEPHHDPMPAADAAPDERLVELPAAAAERRVVPTPTLGERMRGGLDAVVAGVLLAGSWPLWAAIMIEARARGTQEFLVSAMHVGRTRRLGQRRSARDHAPIDRRSIDRRTQDLLGSPIACARFRTDLGRVSRWAGARGFDRIPMLLNVIRGEMALVGPEPEREDVVLRLKSMAPEYDRRFTVLPGFTGLARVSGCADSPPGSATRRIQYDLYYIEHQSLLLDLRTLFRAIRVIFGFRSARWRQTGAHGQDAANGGVPGAMNGGYAGSGYSVPVPPAVKGVSE
jgi:FlaA1/EpsC-like NDP-sugar epimerase/lipopolysaccharide/colanic/teichoic acid biosynthesis glycosyltransferase